MRLLGRDGGRMALSRRKRTYHGCLAVLAGISIAALGIPSIVLPAGGSILSHPKEASISRPVPGAVVPDLLASPMTPPSTAPSPRPCRQHLSRG